MPNIQLKDGTNFAFEGGTAMQLAEAISAGLARVALAAKIDGKSSTFRPRLQRTAPSSF